MSPDRRSFLLRTAGALAGLPLLPAALRAEPVRLSRAVGVGLIGVGRQGRAILTELERLPDVTVAAVCDLSPSRLRIAGERAPAALATAEYRQVLERADLQAVLVATPTHLHRAIVEDAVAAGKHVYCEAPVAHTVEDARALGALAPAGLVVAAGFGARANPLYQRARTMMGSDAMREPVALTAQWHRKTSWRFPAPDPGTARQTNWRLDPAVTTGLAGEVGSHQFDVARWFLGAMPVTVRGGGSLRHHRDGRELFDTVHADLVWPDGVTLRWQATLANSFGGAFEVIQGVTGAMKLADQHGWLFKEADAPTQGWEVYAARQQFYDDEGIVLRADATKLAAQGQLQAGEGLPFTTLYYGLADFFQAVTEGTPVACPIAEGAASTILGILAHRAIVSGEPVPVPAAG